LEYRIRFKKNPVRAGSGLSRGSSKKYATLHTRAWNDRFNVTYSKDNDRYHTFYKEYFDKPIRVKTEHVTFTMKPQDPEVINKIKYAPISTSH
jgi:hypothetical protein